jgi:hypothetical protein
MRHMRSVALGVVLFTTGVGTGHAGCDNSALNGVYPFAASGYTLGIYDSSGTLQYLSAPQPLSSVGQYIFDGQGGFTRVDFNVGNGFRSTRHPRQSVRLASEPTRPALTQLPRIAKDVYRGR